MPPSPAWPAATRKCYLTVSVYNSDYDEEDAELMALAPNAAPDDSETVPQILDGTDAGVPQIPLPSGTAPADDRRAQAQLALQVQAHQEDMPAAAEAHSGLLTALSQTPLLHFS